MRWALCESFGRGSGIGCEVWGDDGDVFFFPWTGNRTEGARVCAEQRVALEVLVYGGGFARKAWRKFMVVLFKGNPTYGNYSYRKRKKKATGSGFRPANPTTAPSIPPKTRYRH